MFDFMLNLSVPAVPLVMGGMWLLFIMFLFAMVFIGTFWALDTKSRIQKTLKISTIVIVAIFVSFNFTQSDPDQYVRNWKMGEYQLSYTEQTMRNNSLTIWSKGNCSGNKTLVVTADGVTQVTQEVKAKECKVPVAQVICGEAGVRKCVQQIEKNLTQIVAAGSKSQFVVSN